MFGHFLAFLEGLSFGFLMFSRLLLAARIKKLKGRKTMESPKSSGFPKVFCLVPQFPTTKKS